MECFEPEFPGLGVFGLSEMEIIAIFMKLWVELRLEKIFGLQASTNPATYYSEKFDSLSFHPLPKDSNGFNRSL